MMEQVYIVADMAIDASADEVWSVVGAFADPALGKGFVSDITGEGVGVGALRTLHLTAELGGGMVVERQTARDDRGRYYAYELVDRGVMPFEEYYASAQVAPLSDKSCRVIWLNRYRTPRNEADAARAQSRKLLEMIEANLKSELAARQRERSRT